jgi:ubiquitin C-terminal hydrolase
MSEESQGGPKYRLIATVCHHSFGYGGMNSGHYTAKCKSSSGTWNEFDDTTVCSFCIPNSNDRYQWFRFTRF